MFWNGNTAIDGGQRCHIGCADSWSRRVQSEPDRVNPHRPRDLLDLLLAQSLKGNVELVAYLIVGRATDADAVGLGQGFKTGSMLTPSSKMSPL